MSKPALFYQQQHKHTFHVGVNVNTFVANYMQAQRLDTDGSVHHSNGPHSAHPAHSSHSHKATYSSNFTVPSAASTAHSAAEASAAASAANTEMLESTPYLIMQQQQKNSALTKRQHSGAMDSFFKVTSGIDAAQLRFANLHDALVLFCDHSFPLFKHVFSTMFSCQYGCEMIFPQKSTAAPVVKKAKLNTEVGDTAQAVAPQEKKAVFNANSIRFKFNQGFSNAVKRTVLMDEFL